MKENETVGSTRRSFYSALISVISTLIGVTFSAPVVTYLFAGSRSRKKGEFAEAVSLTQLQLQRPQAVIFERTRVDGWRISREKAVAWVVRADRQVVAFAPECTHLGCAYHWDDRDCQFVCPCHGSRFSIDGKVAAGPAARALDRYAVRVDGDKLLIGFRVSGV